MGRVPRLQSPGTYHVTSRGAGPSRIFIDDIDRSGFLEILAGTLGRTSSRCDAYCLMDTHYHLVIDTPEPNIATAMQRLNGLYARSFNRRHGRRGHLFGSRYYSVLIQTDGHLLEVLRYLALNPVRAGLCARPDEWPWSSYRSVVDARSTSVPLSDRAVRLFETATSDGGSRFGAFVADATR